MYGFLLLIGFIVMWVSTNFLNALTWAVFVTVGVGLLLCLFMLLATLYEKLANRQ
jgi:hypothetical protein